MTSSIPLRLDAASFRRLLERQGPSLGLWRAAEVAALREIHYQPPVLDLGCGDGFVTSLVLPWVAVGVDPDAALLSDAAQLGIYERLVLTRAETMSVREASIGTVISNSVLEHLVNLDAVLEAAARALRPGGRLVLTVPTATLSHWLLLPSPRYAAWRNRQLQHLNLWSANEWRPRLQRVGLEVELVRPYLRSAFVRLWDALELLQQVWVGRRRVFGMLWRRLPTPVLDRLAASLSRLDLSAPDPSGGLLIAARRA